MKNRKVVFVLPSLHGGGAEGVVVRLAHGLLSCGFDISILTLESRQQYQLDKRINLISLSKLEGQSSKFKKLLSSVKQIILLHRYVRSNKDACYISFLERPILYLGFVRCVCTFQSIASFRNHTSSHLKAGRNSFHGRLIVAVYKRLLGFSSRQYSHLDFLSQAVKDDFDKEFFDTQNSEARIDTSVIYNGYNAKKIKERSLESLDEDRVGNFMKENRCLVSVGRIEEQKGYLYFLPVLAELKRRGIYAPYFIVGDGSLRQNVKDTAIEFGLRVVDLAETDSSQIVGADVIITGFTSNPFTYVSRSMYFVFPSLWEGFGNALVEALCVGTPVFSADCPVGPREILDVPLAEDLGCAVRRGNGGSLLPLLRNPLNHESTQVTNIWCDELEKAVSMDTKKYSQLRLETVERAEYFSEKKQLDAWIQLIEMNGAQR